MDAPVVAGNTTTAAPCSSCRYWLPKGDVDVLAHRIVRTFPLTEKSADDDSPLPASYTIEVADAGFLMPTSRLSAKPSTPKIAH